MASLASLLAGVPDPEAQGAANNSNAMAPVVGPYLRDALAQALPQNTFDPNRSFGQNALDPRGIENAMNMRLGFGGGGLGTVIPFSRLAGAQQAKQAASETAARENTRQAIEQMRDRLMGQPTYEVPPAVKDALKFHDNLGFDSVGEALGAVRAHPDWRDRWDAQPKGAYYEGLDDIGKARFRKTTDLIDKFTQAPPGTFGPEFGYSLAGLLAGGGAVLGQEDK